VISLLDVNVLVALAWPNHVHHAAAQHWFGQNRRQGWATCSITQTGFVRVSSNVAVMAEARSPREALGLLGGIIRLPHHAFWTDDLSITDARWIAIDRLVGYRQITDAQLLGLALKRGGRLATLDRDIRTIVPKGFDADQVVAIISGDLSDHRPPRCTR